jgi:hypothetical protein
MRREMGDPAGARDEDFLAHLEDDGRRQLLRDHLLDWPMLRGISHFCVAHPS